MAPVTVEEYSRQFYAKALRGGFGGTPEESARAGSASLYALLKKLLDAGEREDCAVPLRVLRDELMEAYRAAASAAARKAPVEALFALYDGVVRLATDEAQGPPGPAKDLALVVLEEVRARFYKLVVGETWEPYPELKKLALLRLWGFRNSEKLEKAAGDPEGNGAVLGLPPDHQVAGKKKGWLGKMSGGGADSAPKGYQSWQTTFKSMQRASGQKLMVLLEQVLVEFCGDVSDSTGVAAADELGEAVPIAGGPPKTLARKVTEGVPVGESAGTLQGDALIDLLTLDDPAPTPPAPTPDLFAAQAQAPPPPAPAAAPDLFAAQASPASSAFASLPAPAPATSNPFAEDMFFQAPPPPAPAAGGQAGVENSFFADLNPGFKQ